MEVNTAGHIILTLLRSDLHRTIRGMWQRLYEQISKNRERSIESVISLEKFPNISQHYEVHGSNLRNKFKKCRNYGVHESTLRYILSPIEIVKHPSILLLSSQDVTIATAELELLLRLWATVFYNLYQGLSS